MPNRLYSLMTQRFCTADPVRGRNESQVDTHDYVVMATSEAAAERKAIRYSNRGSSRGWQAIGTTELRPGDRIPKSRQLTFL